MGAPTSILAETYIQHMENTQIYPILIEQQIIAYFGNIDDILIIYCDKVPRRPKCLVRASVISTVPSTAVIVQRALTNY
jgi:hypothetical protein